MSESLSHIITDFVISLFWVLFFFTPVIVVFWRIARMKRSYEAEAKLPFTDLPLRPPGESTRIEAEKRFEAAMENLVFLIAGCGISGFTVAQSKPSHRLALAGICTLAVVGITAFTGTRLVRALREYRRYSLGFRGERLVGQELDQLLAKGYRVFHDVPFDGYNVDHIAVGPAGVFVVETKTRRKWKVKELKHPAHMVYYDGTTLTWPSGRSDRFGLDQTERNARSVSEWLTAATGEAVACIPILTLPGWWVERQTLQRPVVTVLSSKKLHRYFPTKSPQPIRPEQVRRLCYHLGERCRLDDSGKRS